ncbi:hypothetical protein H0H87_010755, partial [Tephrocybe sp. NHM501043]
CIDVIATSKDVPQLSAPQVRVHGFNLSNPGNPYADVKCVTAALKDITNPPSTCVGCKAVLKEKAKVAGDKVKAKAASARAGASSLKAGARAKAQTLGHKVKGKFTKGQVESGGQTELSTL